MATRYNIEMDQGSEWRVVINWQNEDETPIDLTGWTGALQVRRTADAEEVLLSLTDGDGIEITDPTDGEITVVISSEKSSAMPARTSDKNWVYDLEVTPLGGGTVRLLDGKFLISHEVTRA